MTAEAAAAHEPDAFERTLARSALYEALALGFGVPTPEVTRRLASAEGAAGLVAAAAFVHADLAPLICRLAAADVRPETLAAAYERLFGHTAQGEVPLFETEYGADEPFLQPQELADVGGFYGALGLAVAPGAGERPDHVRCECEFLMCLTRREAVAVERADTEARTATAGIARLFLRDHLGRFLPALAARLTRLDADGFYGALGALAARFIELECARASVPTGPPALHFRLPIDDGAPMACGSCPLGSGEGAEDDDGD